MAGVESLTKQILLDAEEKAEGILLEARERAAGFIEEARLLSEKDSEEAAVKAENEAADYAKRVKSQIGMLERQTLLKAKQDLIETMIAKAKATLLAQSSDDYFAMLLGILRKHVRTGHGEMLLSKEDFARLPGDFAAKADAIAKEKDGSLSVAAQTGEGTKVENGFVLRYGGIEENCTLDALFQDKTEDLRDACSKVLFTENHA